MLKAGNNKEDFVAKKETNSDYRVEIERLKSGYLEVRYFDDVKNRSYLAWRLPAEVVDDVVKFWRNYKITHTVHFPIVVKTDSCEITMFTKESVQLREFDALGRYRLSGWHLPKDVMDIITEQHGEL